MKDALDHLGLLVRLPRFMQANVIVSHREKSYSEEENLVVHRIVSSGVCRSLSRTKVTVFNQNMCLQIWNSIVQNTL